MYLLFMINVLRFVDEILLFNFFILFYNFIKSGQSYLSSKMDDKENGIR